MRASDAFERLPDAEVVTAPLAYRFGIDPETFAGHRFWHRPSAKAIWVAAAEAEVPEGLRPEAFGMLVSRMKGKVFKPSTVFIQRFGAAATRNRYALTDAQLDVFLRRAPVTVSPVDDGDGAVLVTDARGHVLGLGRLTGAELLSELPKSWTLGHGDG